MADLELSLTITPYDRVQPLITGEVKPEGITLRYTELPLQQIWRRQARRSRSFFQVGSMASTRQ